MLSMWHLCLSEAASIRWCFCPGNRIRTVPRQLIFSLFMLSFACMNFGSYVPQFVHIYFSEVDPFEHDICKENGESWKKNFKVVVVVAIEVQKWLEPQAAILRNSLFQDHNCNRGEVVHNFPRKRFLLWLLCLEFLKSNIDKIYMSQTFAAYFSLQDRSAHLPTQERNIVPTVSLYPDRKIITSLHFQCMQRCLELKQTQKRQ